MHCPSKAGYLNLLNRILKQPDVFSFHWCGQFVCSLDRAHTQHMAREPEALFEFFWLCLDPLGHLWVICSRMTSSGWGGWKSSGQVGGYAMNRTCMTPYPALSQVSGVTLPAPSHFSNPLDKLEDML